MIEMRQRAQDTGIILGFVGADDAEKLLTPFVDVDIELWGLIVSEDFLNVNLDVSDMNTGWWDESSQGYDMGLLARFVPSPRSEGYLRRIDVWMETQDDSFESSQVSFLCLFKVRRAIEFPVPVVKRCNDRVSLDGMLAHSMKRGFKGAEPTYLKHLTEHGGLLS
jgi:hypothetical protein